MSEVQNAEWTFHDFAHAPWNPLDLRRKSTVLSYSRVHTYYVYHLSLPMRVYTVLVGSYRRTRGRISIWWAAATKLSRHSRDRNSACWGCLIFTG